MSSLHRLRVGLAVFAAAILPAGCGDDPRSGAAAGGMVVGDTLGVPLVVSSAPLWPDGQGWRISPASSDRDGGMSLEPSLRIGTVEGEDPYLFGRIVGATRLSDGRIAVLDGMALELRVFSAQGGHRWTAGGRGEGPGELRRPMGLARLANDVIQVEDTQPLSRIRFSAEGELLGHETVELVSFCRVVPGFVGEWLLRGGGECSIDATETVSRSEVRRLEVTLERSPWTLERADTLGTFPTREWWVHALEAGGPIVLPIPASPVGHFAVGGHPPKLAFATSARYRIHLYDMDEAMIERVFEVSSGDRMRPLGAADLAQAWEEWERTAEFVDLRFGAGSGRRLLAERSAVPLPPDSIPTTPIQGLLVDETNHVWARLRSEPESGVAPWMVFREDGVFLGEVDLPRGLVVHEIGRDYVLGIMQGELDVPVVELYALERGGGGP